MMTNKHKITKNKFSEILLTFMVGDFVRELVSEENKKKLKQLEEGMGYMLNIAVELEFDDLIEDLHGSRLPENSLCLREEEIVREFSDFEFWETLELRLGQRDYYKSLSSSEKYSLAKSFWLPDKVHEYYEKYRKELEKHGVDRLYICEQDMEKVK
ncbi:hypothetical protein KKC62_03620 [Patescibacteria group bacterium]|nr:hypothetical protein [Patescibacteria group bacterium]MBU1953264.1 hypothetical protein [Patescibacteria group bacterium]